MSARAVTIVDALKDVFVADATLAGWFGSGSAFRCYTFRDPILIEDTNPIYPFMVIDCTDVKIGDAGNVRQQDVRRETYPIQIMYAVSSLDEESVKRGTYVSGTLTAPGLFDVFDRIMTILKSNQSLGDAVRYAADMPSFIATAGKNQHGENWIGRAGIVKEVYQDISKY